MAGEWRATTLGDAANVLTGFPFKSEAFSTNNDDVRLLRGDNVAQGTLRWDGVKRWPVRALEGLDAYQLHAEDVVLAMDRPWIEAGLKFAVVRPSDLPCLLVQRVSRLRAKTGVDQRFLAYVIGSSAFTNYILGVQTGTAVPHISLGQIKAFSFILPPLATQQAIGRLLGSLDDKIELNRRTAATLEELARALFKSWFVDFDPIRAKAEGRSTGLPAATATLFPDKFGDDGLPEGWSERPFGDVFDVRNGNTPSTEDARYWGGDHYWATPKDLSPLKSPVLLSTDRTLTDEGVAVVNSGLLPAGSVLISTRAPIGYLAFVASPIAINQGMAGIVGKKLSTAFAWLWCAANIDTFSAVAGGSTFPEISKGTLRKLPMVVPTADVTEAFAACVDPIVERLVELTRENDHLATLRDTLLPRLISGELRIKDDAAQGEAA